MANLSTNKPAARAGQGFILLSELAANYRPARRVRGPIVSRDGGGAVRCLGQVLDDPIWTGAEWSVTRYGVERRDGKFAIQHERIAEGLASAGWCSTFSELGEVDADDFGTAILVCAALHGHALTADDVRRLVKFVESRRGEASR